MDLSAMLFAEAMLAHTPPWVWLAFGLVVWRGIGMTRPRTVTPARFFSTPALFLVLGVMGLVERPGPGVDRYLAWGAAALLVLPLGWFSTPAGLRYDAASRRIHLPGSSWPLVRLVAVFVLQYASYVALAVAPADAGSVRLAAFAVSGANAGFFAGFAAGAGQRLRNARGHAPDAAATP